MASISFEEFFVELYDQALKMQQDKCYLNDNRISQAARSMVEAYRADRGWTLLTTPRPCDYDDPAYRCAYLHKYAACHSGLVCEVLLRAAQQGPALDHLLHGPGRGVTNLCCLGGGPGVDVVAYLTLLELVASCSNGILHVRVVDRHRGWIEAFGAVVQVLRTERYGHMLARLVSNRNFQCGYVEADLLQAFRPATRGAIESADLMTMVKFVSAAACRDTDAMIAKIFSAARPGALVLFVDNAAGGFHEMASRAASRCGLQSVYGPLRHEHYEHNTFRTRKFGFERLSETKVAVQIWRKGVHQSPYSVVRDVQRRTTPISRRISVRTGATAQARSTPLSRNISVTRATAQTRFTPRIPNISVTRATAQAPPARDDWFCCII